MASAFVSKGELVAVLRGWTISAMPIYAAPIYAVTATMVWAQKTRLFLDFVQVAVKNGAVPI